MVLPLIRHTGVITAGRGAQAAVPRAGGGALFQGAEVVPVEGELHTGEYPPVCDPAGHLGRLPVILDGRDQGSRTSGAMTGSSPVGTVLPSGQV